LLVGIAVELSRILKYILDDIPTILMDDISYISQFYQILQNA